MKKLLFIFAAIGIFATAVYAFELNTEPQKSSPAPTDLVGIEDSEDNWQLKAVELGKLPISTPVGQALDEKASNDGVVFELTTLSDLTIGGSPLVDDIIIPSDPTAASKLWSVAKVGIVSQSQVFAEPDTLAGVTTTWPLISFPIEKFPNGVTIVSVRVSTLTACTDSVDFEEWPMGSTSGTEVGSLTMSGTYTASSSFTDANLAEDTTLYIRLPVSPTDTEFYDVNVTFLIK